MDGIRSTVMSMQKAEESLLAERMTGMNKYATYTPIVVIVAALLAIIITFISFFNIKKEFNQRTALQLELEELNQETAHRVSEIEKMAGKVALGEYQSQVSDSRQDSLGRLAGSLNKMAASLQTSFTKLDRKEWQQSGLAQVNDILVKDQDLFALCQSSLREIARYTDASIGVVYAMENGALKSYATLACEIPAEKDYIKPGIGMAGQVVIEKKTRLVTDVPGHYVKLSSLLGDTPVRNLAIVPFVYNNVTVGVMELGYSRDVTEQELEYLNRSAESIAITINMVRGKERVQQLLEETQTQSEELRTQQEELQQLNSELEERSQIIQASEEELRVSNEELEEKAQMMEEQNEAIAEKNTLLELNAFELVKKGDELQLSSKYKSEFLANMSHELRTPLNSILLLSKLLSNNKKGNLDKDQAEYATVINNQGKNLLELIDEILDLASVESGKIKVVAAETALAEIREDLESLFKPVATHKGVTFEVDFEAGLPETILTDKMRLEQVLKNLLSNAFKFTAAGKVSLITKLTTQKSDTGADVQMVAFSVTDTGIGIPADKLQLVFQPFQQADGSTQRKYGGTGLGLSISREIAAMLGGEVTLTSEEGKGSTFTLLVPLAIAKKEEVTLAISTEGTIEVIKPAGITAKKIPNEIEDDRDTITEQDKVMLIVEDDTALAKLLVQFSHERGYKAISVVQGDKAVAAAEQYKPQGIILDIELPVMDGWAVLDALKKNSLTRHIPVHIVSSLQVEKESLVKGSVDFAHKPLSLAHIDAIFDKLEQVLEQKDGKVLIIKAHPLHTQALLDYLQKEKLEVIIADTFPQSIALIDKGKVSCVIIDLTEQQKEGFELLNYLKEHKELHRLPVIIYTGSSLPDQESKKLENYANVILVKTANSYKRVLEETGLFIHLVESDKATFRQRQAMGDVLQGKNILVVDDDARNLFALEQTLASYKMNTVSAQDGAEALKLLRTLSNIDVILMDMMMPVMDGYEAIRLIRSIPKYKQVPIIAVTAKAMPEDRKKTIDAGASDYITKPVDTDQLLSLLRVWLY